MLPNFVVATCRQPAPGETAQQFHIDDDFYRVGRPRPPISLSAIWAIDEFTGENGATEVIPGSHRWGDEVPEAGNPDVVKVVMPAGSVVVFAGTLWHRGGANRSDRPRLAITPQYCEPWARQQEQQILSVGPEAARYSGRIQSMLGYSIHPPFMGQSTPCPAATPRPTYSSAEVEPARLQPTLGPTATTRRRNHGFLRISSHSRVDRSIEHVYEYGHGCGDAGTARGPPR